MNLAACSFDCTYLNDGHCELAAVMEKNQPFICPYRHLQSATTVLPQSISPGWEELPRNFATTRHYRHPNAAIKPVGWQR